MKSFKRKIVLLLKKIEIGSAIAIRLTKLTKKSNTAIHPKHLVDLSPWFLDYFSKKDVVLDLGCGAGENSFKIAKVSKKVFGIDIDVSLIERANRLVKANKLKKINFLNGNLEKKLPFANNFFDKVIFLDVLEHLQRREFVLKEIKRTIKRGGLVLISVPNSQTGWKKLQRQVGLSSYSDPDHKTEFSEEEIKILLKKNGLHIVSFEYGRKDTPFKGFFDILGGFSLSLYKKTLIWRDVKNPKDVGEAEGFRIVAEAR